MDILARGTPMNDFTSHDGRADRDGRIQDSPCEGWTRGPAMRPAR